MSPEKRWYEYWRKGPNPNNELILACRERMWGLYNEPHRAYHNLAHIEFCLAELDRNRSAAKNPLVVEAAIWFHDVIYDTKRKDNEELSASLARVEMSRLGATPRFCEYVLRAIRATTHAAPLKNSEEYIDDMITCDIDLVGLGQDWSLVDEHNKAIRKEYEWVPMEQYISGRIAVMKKFLERPHIYYLPEFKKRYEKKARKNIKRIIVELEAA